MISGPCDWNHNSPTIILNDLFICLENLMASIKHFKRLSTIFLVTNCKLSHHGKGNQKTWTMDSKEFRLRGTEMVEYICKYMETLNSRRVTPSVEPGYLRHLLPDEAPENPENWDEIMQDVETKIMPGVTHWQHPRFHAYFPAGNSYPSILGDMLSDGIGCIGFSWVRFCNKTF